MFMQNLLSTVVGVTMGDRQLNCVAPLGKMKWTLAFYAQCVEADRVGGEKDHLAQVADGVLTMLASHPQPSAENGLPANAYNAGTAPLEDLD